MGLARGEEIAAAVRAPLVVRPHGPGHQRNGLRKAGQRRVAKAEFVFEDAVDLLGHGVFVRLAVLGHAQGHAVAFQQSNVLAGRVLQAPVGVVNHRALRLGTGGQGLVQGREGGCRAPIGPGAGTRPRFCGNRGP